MTRAKKTHQKNKTTCSKMGAIRVIAGKYRGRKLPVLMSEGLRPTTDRVKETLFNWLMPYIQDTCCLDCFAGAGSLGFEALSRGAKDVTLLEFDQQVAKQLDQNKQRLEATNCKVIQTNTLAYLSQPADQHYDIVFIDPPFRKQYVEQTCQLINAGWLAPDALIYVEMENEPCQWVAPNNWTLIKEKNAGQVSYRLYQYDANVSE
ncbi:16S rRNA (guanine(966)-N(2))-methyltransferase RsmD [Thalassotalea ganghwensis]